MYEVKLPRIDDEHNESSIVFWYKQEGDDVSEGETLVDVQTEKAVTEIEAEKSGTLEKIVIQRGEVANVGDTLCIINTYSNEPMETPISQNGVAEASMDQQDKRSSRGFVRIAPRLRRLAKDLNVDLTKIEGTGKNGSITENDIKTASLKMSSGDNLGHASEGIRTTIAARMMDSLQNSAQLTETAYADVTNLDVIRNEYEVKLSWNTWILFSVINAVKQHPYMNGTFENGSLKLSQDIHLGVATDTSYGLLVPVIKNASEYTLLELQREVTFKAEMARLLKLSKDDLSGSTFTVTNLGSYGVHFFTPIINPPELAILGIGKIESYLLKQGDEIMERKRLPLSLTFDHQVIDGAPAARFLKSLIDFLENPKV